MTQPQHHPHHTNSTDSQYGGPQYGGPQYGGPAEQDLLGDRAAEADAAYLAAVHGGVSTDVDTGTDRTLDPTQAGIDQGRLLGMDAEDAASADAAIRGADRSVDQPSTLAQVVAADLARQAAEQGQAWSPARPPWYDDYAQPTPELTHPTQPQPVEQPQAVQPVESPVVVEQGEQGDEVAAFYEAAGIKRANRRAAVLPPSTRTLPPPRTPRTSGESPTPGESPVQVHPVVPAHPVPEPVLTQSQSVPVETGRVEPVLEEPMDFEYQQMLEEQMTLHDDLDPTHTQQSAGHSAGHSAGQSTGQSSEGFSPVRIALGSGTGAAALLSGLGTYDFDTLITDDPDTAPATASPTGTSTSTGASTGAGTKRKKGTQLTPRDIEILTFLARYKYATYQHLAQRFDISYDTLRRRLPKLEREGLLIKQASHKSASLVWAPTTTGIAAAGLDLPGVTINLGSLAHTLGLVELGVLYENHLRETGNPDDIHVVTEREIRAADTRKVTTAGMRRAYAATGQTLPILDEADIAGFTPAELAKANHDGFLYCVQYTNADGKTLRTHIPDMVLVGNPDQHGNPTSMAIELELNHKSGEEWTKILRAYKQSTTLAGVIYYTHRPKVANAIKRIAIHEGIEHRVSVNGFAFSDHLSHIVLNKD